MGSIKFKEIFVAVKRSAVMRFEIQASSSGLHSKLVFVMGAAMDRAKRALVSLLETLAGTCKLSPSTSQGARPTATLKIPASPL